MHGQALEAILKAGSTLLDCFAGQPAVAVRWFAVGPLGVACVATCDVSSADGLSVTYRWLIAHCREPANHGSYSSWEPS